MRFKSPSLSTATMVIAQRALLFYLLVTMGVCHAFAPSCSLLPRHCSHGPHCRAGGASTVTDDSRSNLPRGYGRMSHRLSSSSAASPPSPSDDDDSSSSSSSPLGALRAKLRAATGFSATALRATLRSATGFSLTAFRTTVRAATGISLSTSLSTAVRWILDILSPSLRYFLQPFLVLYYAPMMVMRYWVVGPTKEYYEESLRGHEKVVAGWKEAVEAAGAAQSGGYWPVQINDEGVIIASLPPDPSDVLDLTDAIEQSVAATTSMEEPTTEEPTTSMESANL